MAGRTQPTIGSTKRKRFSAGGITLKAAAKTNDASMNGDGSELVATVRRWGTTFGVFEDGSTTEPLWQIQVAHGGRQAFGYNLLATCREALQDHPNSNVRDLPQLEAHLHVKVLIGAPPMSGPADPDGVGIRDWQPVLYAPTPHDGLNLVSFIVRHKVTTGQILQLPHFIAVCPEEEVAVSVPDPWIVHDSHPLQHQPFRALPPRGRRHVLLQVELDPAGLPPSDDGDSIGEQDAKPEYSLMIFGGIYGYRELFDAANIQGGTVPIPDSAKTEYVRHLKLKFSEDQKHKLTNVLEQVLLNVPVYLIDNTTTEKDPLISWLLEQPSVYPGEKAK